MSQTDTAASGPLHDLTGFQRDVLVAVATLGEPHGVAIKNRLEEEYDTSEIHHSRLYPNLDDVVEMGLVEKGAKDSRTNSYTLSARGRRELSAYRDWIDLGLEDGTDE